MFLGKWGTAGTADGEFDHPTGITSDTLGNVSVVDYGNNRVQVFAPPDLHRQVRHLGSGDGQFSSPWGIAEGSLDTLFVSDSGNSRIERFGEPQTGSTVRRSGSRLIFQARAGKVNNVTVTLAGGLYTFTDTGDSVRGRCGMLRGRPRLATCTSAPA